MHEFHAVSELVEHMLLHLKEERLERATQVTVRRSPHFTDECIRQAFAMQSAGTPLDGARLVIEPSEARWSCACGQSGPVAENDAASPAVLCPACGGVAAVHRPPDLEVLELR